MGSSDFSAILLKSALSRRLENMSTAIRLSQASSPWGRALWRVDRTEFIAFCKAAAADTPSQSKREWNGFLALAFADADKSKTGKLTVAEFDELCENVASLPRRFGLAPSWEQEYGGSMEKRLASRKKMFDAIDTLHGPARGWIGPAMFINWATSHVAGKVAGNIEARSATGKMVDLYHIADYDKDDFLKAMKIAMADKTSPEYARFYEFLLTIFVEEDHDCRGVVSFEAFECLVARAAMVPRNFGLAPKETSTEKLKELYDSMEDTRMGGVTFRKFLQWSVEHLSKKIA